MCRPPLSTAREALRRKQGPELPSRPQHSPGRTHPTGKLAEIHAELVPTTLGMRCLLTPTRKKSIKRTRLADYRLHSGHLSSSSCARLGKRKALSEAQTLHLQIWLPSPTSQLSTSSSPCLWTTSVRTEHAVVSTETWILIPPELGEVSELL